MDKFEDDGKQSRSLETLFSNERNTRSQKFGLLSSFYACCSNIRIYVAQNYLVLIAVVEHSSVEGTMVGERGTSFDGRKKGTSDGRRRKTQRRVP